MDNTEEEIFALALEIAPKLRETFLKQACGGDDGLRARVRELLRLHDDADDFLKVPIGLGAGGGAGASLRIPAESIPAGATGGEARGDGLGAFGGYDLEEVIAEGSMGVVYRARQRALRRTVALKMIRAGYLATEKEVERFRAETRAIARIDHPNIVAVYEAGEEDGRHYFSMQLVEGGTLRDRVATYRGNPEAAVRLMAAVCGAVHACHEGGILHRDLKPGNILIDRSGAPYVTDFGIAKDAKRREELTLLGQVLGTPGYMSPEQARGDAREVTRATDVYSLGAILYELLTGKPPHEGKDVREILARVAKGEPAAPRAIDASIDPGLEEIVLKAMAKDPGRRHASAAELQGALDRWLRRKPGFAGEFMKWIRLNPVPAALIVAVELGLLAAVVWAILWAIRLGRVLGGG